MVEQLFNEIIYCLIEFIEGLTLAVIRLAKWVERVNETEAGLWYGYLASIVLALISFLLLVKWLAGV